MSNQQIIDRLIDEFEQEWSANDIPSIQDYLDGFKPDDSRHRNALLIELISVDMEYCWKHYSKQNNSVKTIENYVAEFEDLGPIADISVAIIQEEYRARQLWGDMPDHLSYLQRFPDRNDIVLKGLARVDEELSLEHPCVAQTVESAERVTGGRASVEPSIEDIRLQYNDYLLHKMIGFGQMGRVYRATDIKTGENVAVKYLRKAFNRDKAAVDRFLREARTVYGLQHDGVVRVDGVGETPGGGYFIVMEYLEGPDLAALVDQGQIGISDAVNWTIQAAEAIEYSNNAGIIHCDIKPGNIVLDKTRNARVTDFGLAQSVTQNFGTDYGIAGTAPYMAPEQACDWWGTVGPHTDAYALGAVLYCLLTGCAPFEGCTVTDVLSQVVSGTRAIPPEVLRPDIPADLAAIINIALTKEIKKRYGSALELAAALREFSNVNLRNPADAYSTD